jgi:hypothetical protein
MISASTQRADIVDAAHVLASLGLVTAYGHVSARAGAAMIITPAADLTTVVASAWAPWTTPSSTHREGHHDLRIAPAPGQRP